LIVCDQEAVVDGLKGVPRASAVFGSVYLIVGENQYFGIELTDHLLVVNDEDAAVLIELASVCGVGTVIAKRLGGRGAHAVALLETFCRPP